MSVVVRLERSEAIYAGRNLDPNELPSVVEFESEWVQLTYEELRVAPDGERLAYYSEKHGGWVLFPSTEAQVKDWELMKLRRQHEDIPFSDIVISTKEAP